MVKSARGYNIADVVSRQTDLDSLVWVCLRGSRMFYKQSWEGCQRVRSDSGVRSAELPRYLDLVVVVCYLVGDTWERHWLLSARSSAL
ncbi:hypothetical protein RRG08_043333 [Elysia crispata]|uniref:Uncharacterized protein n=1 Tax=Elysia crispata TaxID=231223 RepID=A0AAE1BAH4_9GAST|nr:hypothetical protein RRG08_043333 [Elysia crispata]